MKPEGLTVPQVLYIVKAGLIFLLCFVAGCSHSVSVQSPAEQYFNLLDQGLARSRSQMPIITASAQEAAARLVGGGNLYAAESQESFRIEARGRTGGTMCLKRLKEDTPLKRSIE